MVDAVQVASAKSNGCDSGREGLKHDRDDNGNFSFPIADEVQGLGPGVL